MAPEQPVPLSFGACALEIEALDAAAIVHWALPVARLDKRLGGAQTLGHDWECWMLTKDGVSLTGYGVHGLAAIQALLVQARAHYAR